MAYMEDGLSGPEVQLPSAVEAQKDPFYEGDLGFMGQCTVSRARLAARNALAHADGQEPQHTLEFSTLTTVVSMEGDPGPIEVGNSVGRLLATLGQCGLDFTPRQEIIDFMTEKFYLSASTVTSAISLAINKLNSLSSPEQPLIERSLFGAPAMRLSPAWILSPSGETLPVVQPGRRLILSDAVIASPVIHLNGRRRPPVVPPILPDEVSDIPSLPSSSSPGLNTGPLCAGNTDLFFSTSEEEIAMAKKICSSCPQRPACLEQALDLRIDHGVWGGTSERERRRILRARDQAGRH
jgi:WhiB family redox-sensing transcriptional regulator